MTPAARLAAAIEVLDRILAGATAEQTLANWGRANRYAGSGDRNSLRDLVYQALRCRLSHAALGGGPDGRGLILGGLRATEQDVAALFTGAGHAPAPAGPEDAPLQAGPLELLDCPEWLGEPLRASLGADFADVMRALRRRASVFVRVNLRRADLAGAQAMLAAEGIATRAHGLAETALEITENARKIQLSAAYLQGVVELQDAASQAVVAALPLRDGMKVLDHCAGGGGKTLAMAACARLRVCAHDAAPQRMRDLPVRSARAGVAIEILENPEKSSPYDLILVDVPCSGSGSWRRDPQGKWALTPERLKELIAIQTGILERVAPMTVPGGMLAYATCSLLLDENEVQIAAFLGRHPEWELQFERRFNPLAGGDGFFLAILTRIY